MLIKQSKHFTSNFVSESLLSKIYLFNSSKLFVLILLQIFPLKSCEEILTRQHFSFSLSLEISKQSNSSEGSDTSTLQSELYFFGVKHSIFKFVAILLKSWITPNFSSGVSLIKPHVVFLDKYFSPSTKQHFFGWPQYVSAKQSCFSGIIISSSKPKYGPHSLLKES
jgi:hypothetical protein